MTKYNKKNPFPAKIIKRNLLNKEGSTKKTYHLTLDLTHSNFYYKVGDAIAIFPENAPEEVNTLLKVLNKTGDENVADPRSKEIMTLKHFLKTKANLSYIPTFLLKQTENLSLLEQNKKVLLTQFIKHHDLIDFFRMHPNNSPLQQLISYFLPLLPRFYSIASAPIINSNTIDLLVATFSYKRGRKKKKGLASHYLCRQAPMHTASIYTYIHSTPHFVLPEDPTTPIIMVGPGTGIAPYRAFLQEREAQRASGKNWLFFGERNKATDYYYESYLESLVNKNFLSLDLAFSRDQPEKCYVQHRLLERGKEIWSLIDSGAYFYICGDARRMAKNVIFALSSIIETYGNQEGDSYLKKLRKQKRMLLDIY